MTEVEKKEIEKAKVGLIVCAVLIVILAISSVWFYTRIGSLQNQINTLETDKTNLQSQVSSLQSELHSLDSEYLDYVVTHLYESWEYELARFDFYYVFPAEQQFGVYDLADEIYGYEWIEPYQEGVFDCSEMSSYLEWGIRE